MVTLASPIFKDRGKNRGKGRLIAVLIAAIIAISLLFTATTAKAFEKVKNCTLSEYGIRIGYIIGPRVPLVVPLAKADSMQVFDDFFRAFTDDYKGNFLGKYARQEDVERAVKKHRGTLIGNLVITSEFVNNVFYGGHWLNPKRLSCTVCDGDECRVLHADIKFSTTRISHPVAE